MTSNAEGSRENDNIQEKVKPGSSADSFPATDLKEEPDPAGGCTMGTKRLLSTVDPDYAHPPDTKRMREMHQRAQDELSQRVIKVVDKELHSAIVEKEAEMEEIDNRILRLQQCLHTLRYCVSLNCYNIDKGEVQNSEGRELKLSGLHPTIRRHLGKAPAGLQPTSEALSAGNVSQHKTSSLSIAQGGKKGLSDKFQSNSQADVTRPTTTLSGDNRATSSHSSVESCSLPHPSSRGSDDTIEKSEMGDDDELPCSRPPSPKHLPPRPPDNPLTIPQGRQQRFQSKRRLIVGNTYQYLAPLQGEEAVDTFRYKWQVYVRTPPSDPDTSTFLQCVTFVLDQSYAPHHVITIKQPPFVLSRRGWGEFKIQLMLRFIDQRNKPVRLLHPLVLSRPDDALALTGLWRLGQEDWYDLWVYLPNPEITTSMDGGAQAKEEESCPAPLTWELHTGVISSQVDENTTVDHEPMKGTTVIPEHLNKEKYTDDIVSEKSECERTSEKGVVGESSCTGVKKQIPKSSLNESEVADREKSNAKERSEEADGQGNVTNGKVCTVHVRQADGSLKPYLIPSHLYPIALQMSRSHTRLKSSPAMSGNTEGTQELKVAQNSLNKGTDNVLKGNKIQFHKDATISATMKLIPYHSASSPSSNVSGATGGAGSVPEGVSCLKEASGSQREAKGVQTPTDTANGTCQQQQLIQMGIKEKKLALGQKQVNSEVLKQALASGSLHLSQLQMLSPKTPSQKAVTNVKYVSEVPITGLSKVVNQNEIHAGKSRFITNKGQLLMTEKLKSLGLKVVTDAGKNRVIISMAPCTTTSTSTTTTTTTTTMGTTDTVLIQDGRVVHGANSLQLVTSQGKVVKQLSPFKLHIGKESNILPLQPFIVYNKGNHAVLEASGGLVKGASSKIKVKCEGEMKLLKGTVLPSIVQVVNDVSVKANGFNGEKELIGGMNREQQQQQEEQEEGCSTYWEDYLSRVCKACNTSISSAVCVLAWLKALPLVQPNHTPLPPFSFCRATSQQHFLSWSLAKQRACEFQRAREVKWWLEVCHVKGWESWTVPRVVAWARGHAHTPVACRPAIRTDKFQLPSLPLAPENSLSYMEDLEELESKKHQSDTTCSAGLLEVDVVGLGEEKDSQGTSKRTPGSPLIRQLNYLHWEEGEVSSGCEWVGQLTSQLRFSIHSEEVAEGYLADVAHAILWKAVLNLMEDILRAAHFKAWNEAVVIPPPTITLPHVLAALTSSRPEFDVFTDHGLGTPSEAI